MRFSRFALELFTDGNSQSKAFSILLPSLKYWLPFPGSFIFRGATRSAWEGGIIALGGTKCLNLPAFPVWRHLVGDLAGPQLERKMCWFSSVNLFQRTRDSQNNPDGKVFGWGRGVSEWGWPRSGFEWQEELRKWSADGCLLEGVGGGMAYFPPVYEHHMDVT